MPQTSAPSSRRVFVYGTLRRGGRNRLTPRVPLIGTAQIEGVMHHLGAYTGVRLRPCGRVQGEVWLDGTVYEIGAAHAEDKPVIVGGDRVANKAG